MDFGIFTMVPMWCWFTQGNPTLSPFPITKLYSFSINLLIPKSVCKERRSISRSKNKHIAIFIYLL